MTLEERVEFIKNNKDISDLDENFVEMMGVAAEVFKVAVALAMSLEKDGISYGKGDERFDSIVKVAEVLMGKVQVVAHPRIQQSPGGIAIPVPGFKGV